MRNNVVGITGHEINSKHTNKNNCIFFKVLDTLISSAVIAPMVIGYWRGTWNLLEKYSFPNYGEVYLILIAIFGIIVQFVLVFLQQILQNNLNPEKHRIFYYVNSRLYTYVYGLACVTMWRGEWKALDNYSGTQPVQVIVPTVISLIVLICLKILKNLSSTPFVIAPDIYKEYFQVTTMFKLTGSSETALYILDCFFSVFIVGSLVIIVWRGVWVLFDIYLFPEDDKYSAFISLALGYVIVFIIYFLQSPMKKLCQKLKGLWLILAADLYIFISFIGVINSWRGIWNLLNIYFLPKTPLLSNWITHLGCFGFLVLIKCSNSVLVRGVFIDGEEGGESIVFPIKYIRLFVENQRQRRQEVKSVSLPI